MVIKGAAIIGDVEYPEPPGGSRTGYRTFRELSKKDVKTDSTVFAIVSENYRDAYIKLAVMKSELKKRRTPWLWLTSILWAGSFCWFLSFMAKVEDWNFGTVRLN